MSALDDLQRELKRQRESAIDLSRRNRLINVSPRLSAKALQIVDELPDQVAQRLAGGREFTFQPIEDAHGYHEPWIDESGDAIVFSLPAALPTAAPSGTTARRHSDSRLQTNVAREKLETRLRSIQSYNRTELTERGISTLFLAIGFLRYGGGGDDDPESMAPLYLIPVGLEKQRRSEGLVYALHGLGAEPRHNLSLGILLERDHEFVLPDLGEDGILPEEYFALVEDRIRKSKRPWQVVREARLDFFNYSGLSVNVDLDPRSWPADSKGVSTLLTNQNVQQAVFGDLKATEPELGSPEIYEVDKHPLGRELVTPMPADSSQASAIIDAMEGRSIIIEGPPGTGKSQTIANLIAMEMSQGKTVLFVAEKPAALQVVQSRLDRLGFEHYICYQHSANTSTAAIYERLRARLDLPRPRPPHRRIEQVKADLERERQRIQTYLDSLHSTTPPLDESLHDLIWNLSRKIEDGGQIRTLEKHERVTSRDSHVERIRVLEEIATTLDKSPRSHFEMWIGVSAHEYTPASRDAIRESAANYRGSRQERDRILQSLAEHIGAPFEDVDAIPRELAEQIFSALPPDQLGRYDWLAKALLPSWNIEKARELRDGCRVAMDADNIALNLEEPLTRAMLDRADAVKIPCPWPSHTSRQFVAILRETAATGLQAFETAVASLPPGSTSRLGIADVEALRNVARIAERAKAAGLKSIHPEMFHRGYLRELKYLYLAAKELIAQRQELRRTFDLSRLAPTAHLFSLADRARAYQGRFLRFLMPGWHRLRAEIRGITYSGTPAPTAYTPDALLALARLSESIEKFNERTFPELRHLTVDLEDERTLERLNTIAKCCDAISRLELPVGFEIRSAFDLAENQAKLASLEQATTWATALRVSLQHAFEDESQHSAAHVALMGHTWQSIREMLKSLEHFADSLERLTQGRPDLADLPVDALMESARSALAWFSTHRAIDSIGIRASGSAEERRLLMMDVAAAIDSILKIAAIARFPFQKMRENRHDWWFTAVHELGTLLQKRDELRDRCEAAILDLAVSLGEDAVSLGSSDAWQVAEQLADLVHDHVDSLPTWSQICRLTMRAAELGVSEWASEAIDGSKSPTDAIRDYQTSVLYHVAMTRFSAEGSLRGVTGDTLDTARTRFQSLDAELRELSRSSLIRGAHPDDSDLEWGENAARVGEKTQGHLIQHEVQKQRRHLKLRPLFERADRVLMQLQPCWMMNPTTVAEVLPRVPGLFDLVVFDEASQIKTVHSLGALARGKQFVVVGDPKQLPPTSFFDKTTSAEESDPDEHVSSTDSTSVLEALARTMPPRRYRRLRWHYRSEHESLIAFSNRQFYDGDLIVFPAASHRPGELGVSRTFVEGGVFESGRNIVEATCVAKAVIEHAKLVEPLAAPPSLGVAAMNLAQSELIAELIDKYSAGDARAVAALRKLEAMDEPLFIKNLENVQGDERDIIFISFTYGPDPASGRVMQRFGPINQSGGWKRLNVLVTRARRSVRAFTSMNAADIVAGPNSAAGAKAMRDYIEYAATGVIPDRGAVSGRGFDSPFEASVAKVLTEMGLEAVPQVGVAGFFVDLGVRVPGNPDYILGIECDGEMYHSARSARDRDAIRQAVIESKGWKIHRIWSTDWFTNREHAIERLQHAVREAAG